MRKNRVFYTFILILAIVLSFQNCADYQLTQHKSLNSFNVLFVEPTYLKPPIQTAETYRAVFFVDMSHSMFAGPCVDSVDTWVDSSIQAVNCSLPTGVDTSKNRLQLIEKWLDETKESLEIQGQNIDHHLQVMIIPFSRSNDLNYFERKFLLGDDLITQKFRPFNEAKRFVKKLHAVQDCIKDANSCSIDPELTNAGWRWTHPLSTSIMQTSVPGPAMVDMKSQIHQELENLRNNGKLASSRFEIIFLSDGVPKPRIDHISAVFQRIWATTSNRCISRCSAEIDSYLTNNNFSATCENCFSEINNFRVQGGKKPSSMMTQYWGDYNENRIEMIRLRLNQLRLQFIANPETQYRFSFVRLDSTDSAKKTPDYELNPSRNWITDAQTLYNGINYRYAIATNNSLPFSLFPNVSGGEAYVLESLFVLNLNAKVNNKLTLAPDSDGDGLTDQLEVQIGSSPHKARSNSVCLDSVVNLMAGCKQVICDPEKDSDADGLNECDEQTLGTSDRDFDTDGDMIPDYLEILYGYNPLLNDRNTDSNNDGVSNFRQFQMGINSLHDYKQFDVNELIDFESNFAGFQQHVNADGSLSQLAGYNITFRAPRVNTEALTTNAANHIFAAGSIKRGENQILILVKAVNVRNPTQSYWMGQKIKVNSSNQPQNINVDLSQLEYLKVLDPKLEEL